MILLEHGQTLTGGYLDIAAGGLDIARKKLQEGGLARTVGTDDTVTVAGSELQVHILVEHALAELETHIVGCNHWLLFILFFISAQGVLKNSLIGEITCEACP